MKLIDCAELNRSNDHKIQEAVNFWSVNIVKVLWYFESFVQTAVLEAELLLCPGFDCKNIIWKRMNAKHNPHMMQILIQMNYENYSTQKCHL